jgi:hypothetical protein
MNVNLNDKQKNVCSRFGASFVSCDPNLKVGVSRNVKDGVRPLNGLRVNPEGDTCGWYIWAGEKMSEEPDFFVPLHLEDWAPLVLPYLGLPPGWRFLITEAYEDVWEDAQLLGGEK